MCVWGGGGGGGGKREEGSYLYRTVLVQDLIKQLIDYLTFTSTSYVLQDQYAFIHDAVLETLICGDTQIPASDIQRALH